MNKNLKRAVQLVKDVAFLDGRLVEMRAMDLLLRANASPMDVMYVTGDVFPSTNGGVFYCALKRANNMAKEQIERNADIAAHRKTDKVLSLKGAAQIPDINVAEAVSRATKDVATTPLSSSRSSSGVSRRSAERP